MKKVFIILLFIFPSLISFGQQNNSRLIYQKLKFCKLPDVPDSVLCGTYPVIENRETNKGRIINLNIIVIPALHPDSLLAPIFDIDGGPGIADTKNAAFYADSSSPYRQYHDIVLIDVRGTGKSNSLYCPSLQYKTSVADQVEDMYTTETVKQCYDELCKHADLRQYTTTNVVKDLEDVRKWLGYEKINIFSLSYGTRVALVYMKMYPSSIASCILWSPISTYGRIPLYYAKFAQDALDQLFENCKSNVACNETFPNLRNEFATIMEKAKQQPFKAHYTDSSGQSQEVTIPWNAFQTKLRMKCIHRWGSQQFLISFIKCILVIFHLSFLFMSSLT